MKKKISRNINWTVEEKIGFVNQLKNRIHIIENRDPNPDVVELRNRNWRDIHHELKRKRISFREVIRLKECWSRIKAQAKLEMSTFSRMLKKHGVDASYKWRPSNISIEVKRLLYSLKHTQSGAGKIKEEFNTTGYLLQILDSQVPPQSMEMNSCQTRDDDPLSLHFKTEDYSPVNSFIEPPTEIYLIENNKSFNDGMIDSVNSRGKKIHDIEDSQDDIKEENVSFAEIEYTKDDSNKVQWSYDALNEEHKMKIQLLRIELEKADFQKQTALNELKMSEIKLRFAEVEANNYQSKVRMSGERGSGAGQGGGGGGAIRNAGGSFGKMEAAHEDQYFYNQQKEQLKKMREELTDEISFHEEQIKRHEEAINRHKKRIGDMEK